MHKMHNAWVVQTADTCLLRRRSTWNQLNLFTGWADVELSELGVQEATAGGVELKKTGLQFDIAFTSLLQRAQNTCAIALEECEQSGIPIVKDYRLKCAFACPPGPTCSSPANTCSSPLDPEKRPTHQSQPSPVPAPPK